MSELAIIKSSTLTDIADAIRTKNGLGDSDLIPTSEMASEILSIGSGVDLPDLTNPASASHLLSGKEAIDENGNKITGNIAIKTSDDLTSSGATVTVPAGYYASQTTKSISTATQATPSISVDANGLITASATQTAGYVSSGTKSTTKQLTTQATKTITPSTSSQTAVEKNMYTTGAVTVNAVPTQTKSVTPSTSSQTVSPDSGKFLSSVTVNAISTATKAKPTISVNANGTISASYTQSAGYVTAGTVSATSVTLGSSHDSDFVASNIKKGVTIFGVTGTYVPTFA